MKDKYKLFFIIIVVFSFISLYLLSNKTYTAYESNVKNNIALKVADWKINIDDQDISNTSRDISLKNIVWDSEHTSENKVAPGSKGVVSVIIDPTTTQVAVAYNISYIDHTMDPGVILTVTSIYLDGKELVNNGDSSFSGLLTLDDIKMGKKMSLVIHVEWINDENNNESDSMIGLNESEPNYLKLDFTASQYKGE